MEHVVLESHRVRPRVALDTLSQGMGMDRGQLVYYLPELEAYPNGNVEVQALDDGNYHVMGDLAAVEEPVQYFEPVQMQFYSDRADALRHVVPLDNPRVMEMPKRINVKLIRQQEAEEPVYLVRDMYQAESAGLPADQVPAGVVRAVIKRPPTQDEMMATYDSYQNRIAYAPEPRSHEQGTLVAVDRLGSYQPHYVAHAGQHNEMGHYMVDYPELHGYRPAHLRQMSHALQARNPLYLRNAPMAKVGRRVGMEEVLRIVLWVAVGILVGVLLGIYFT